VRLFVSDRLSWPRRLRCAAALLVMRPSAQALRLPAMGRPVSVCVGAVAAIGLLAVYPPHWTLGDRRRSRGGGRYHHSSEPLVRHARLRLERRVPIIDPMRRR
jgi:hypothetical protein